MTCHLFRLRRVPQEHLRVPAAFLALVAMLCTVRLFFWAYLELEEPASPAVQPGLQVKLNSK